LAPHGKLLIEPILKKIEVQTLFFIASRSSHLNCENVIALEGEITERKREHNRCGGFGSGTPNNHETILR
jgi:hypothetical protein